RLELTHGSGRGVARIGKNREPLFFALLVHSFKGGDGHEHLATDFEVRGNPRLFQFFQWNRERNGAHGAHVQGDVFADGTVATGDAADQFATLVVQGQRHAVELQFANIVNIFAAAELVDATLPGAELVFAVGIVQRKHGRGMRRFENPFARLAADALRGRVGRDQVGVIGFQLLQLIHELVELGVRNFRRVEDVVQIFVAADFFPKRFDLFFGAGHDQEIIFGDRKAYFGNGHVGTAAPGCPAERRSAVLVLGAYLVDAARTRR